MTAVSDTENMKCEHELDRCALCHDKGGNLWPGLESSNAADVVERHFLFSYAHPKGVGSLSVSWSSPTADKSFPRRTWVCEKAAEYSGFKVDEVVVTGFCEFKTKQDFEAFNS